MHVDFKNYNKPGVFPSQFQITGEIKSGKFPITLKYNSSFGDYEDDEPTSYLMKFNYCFNFFYKKVAGKAFVYRGGFHIQYKKPYGKIYTSSHCNHFSMPICQHYTDDGQFSQFFIDRFIKELNYESENMITDEVSAITRYANQRKGR